MILENVFFAIFTILSGALLLISLLAYRRSSSRRMLVLAGVFVLFLLKGMILTVSLFMDLLSLYWLLVSGAGMDSLALILLYLTTMKV
jgi:hypothetical protein